MTLIKNGFKPWKGKTNVPERGESILIEDLDDDSDFDIFGERDGPSLAQGQGRMRATKLSGDESIAFAEVTDDDGEASSNSHSSSSSLSTSSTSTSFLEIE